MTIRVQCECGTRLKAQDRFAGTRAECPACGNTLQISKPGEQSAEATSATVENGTNPPSAAKVSDSSIDFPMTTEIKEFLDPPTAPAPRKEQPPVFRRMFEALLDPRSIQWMLTLGGGLAVLGLIIWLNSLGVFEEPAVLAVVMGVATAAVLGAGWLIVLRTRYKIAGQALTFLACMVAPLNLWFYHVNGLVTLDGNLWVGGLVCCLAYAATAYMLRDPLFVYVAEGGITLSVLLLMADLGYATVLSSLSLCFVILGLVSVHAVRAFPPDESDFSRDRFGMPLFWSGQVQLGLGLVILLAAQSMDWLNIHPPLGYETGLGTNQFFPGLLWLFGTYAYLFSDIAVRRIGLYTYLAAFCLLWAIVTLVGWKFEAEGVILVLALTALAANLAQNFYAGGGDRLTRVAAPLGIVLSSLPVLIGVVQHIRATSSIAEHFLGELKSDWIGWPFVIVMLVVAATSRVSAYLYRHSAVRQSAVYFFFSAAALLVAAAGLLRALSLTEWSQQAPLLMLIPIAYIIASRLWRGHSPERPLGWVAHAATAVILVHVLVAAVFDVKPVIDPFTKDTDKLLLGLVFAEATLFYALAGYFRRRSVNAYFAAAAACGAVWQFMGYWGIDDAYNTLVFAILGITFLAVSRSLGLEQTTVYRGDGGADLATRGPGLPAFQSGNSVLTVAFLAAVLQGLTRLPNLSPSDADWLHPFALALTAVAAAVAIWLVPTGGWRRWYTTSLVGLTGLTAFTLERQIDLTGWQKLEVFCVVAGIGMLTAGHIGRFRESEDKQDDMVSFGLFLGSLLATLPLLVAVIYHRFVDDDPSAVDELAMLVVAVVMLVTGYSWQTKSTTLFGGGALTVYLVMLIHFPDVATGVRLAVGGAVLFACGIALSIYREKLLQLPDRIANREGIFRIINWR